MTDLTETKNGAGTAESGSPVKQDFLASIVVFLVALPLCMGIAIASGAPPAAGLVTGIIGGILVGPIAGAPLQVSGPAAGLAVIVYDLLQKHGYETFALIVLAAGVVQLVAGLLRMGQWFRAVAPAVIQGMLAGIGVLIFASQFHVMVDDSPKGNGLENLITIPMAVWKGITPMDDSYHHHAAIIGLLTIALLAFWKPLAPKKVKWLPGPLIAVVGATVTNLLLGWEIIRIELPSSFIEALSFPDFAQLGVLVQGDVIIAVVTIAAVASAETLLCANAVDQLHNGPRAKYDRELAAQGVGNILCGFVGGLPMTGVIVRSSANIESGATTRLSATLHGVWLLLFVVVFPMLLTYIPRACLAAVLVYTGYRLMNLRAVKKLAQAGKGEVVIYIATVGTIVAVDLLTGVLVGIGLSVLKLVYTFSHLSIEVVPNGVGGRINMWIEGAATFLRLPRLAAALEDVPGNAELHVHMERLDYIDHACLELLVDWERQHESTGGRLVIDWEELTARFRSPQSAPPGRQAERPERRELADTKT